MVQLDDRQRLVLETLMRGAGPADNTAKQLAARSGFDAASVHSTLRGLESLQPPLVAREIDATLETEFWIATQRDSRSARSPAGRLSESRDQCNLLSSGQNEPSNNQALSSDRAREA